MYDFSLFGIWLLLVCYLAILYVIFAPLHIDIRHNALHVHTLMNVQNVISSEVAFAMWHQWCKYLKTVLQCSSYLTLFIL